MDAEQGSTDGEGWEIEGYHDWKGRPAYKGKHGGWRATYCLFAVEGFEHLAYIPIAVDSVTYLVQVMHFSLASSANAITNFAGTTYILTLLGGFVSDSYLNRFWTIIISCHVALAGYLLLAAHAHFSRFQPPQCNMTDSASHCRKSHGLESLIFFLAFYLVALGAGGIKSNIPAQGGDQFDEHDPDERQEMSSFFNWLFFCLCTGTELGLTCVVWIYKNVGADLGYLLSAVAMFGAVVSMALGASTFRNKIPEGSPLTRIAQVFSATIRKRHLSLPPDPELLHEISYKDAALKRHLLLKHTDQFRFLDKAAIRDRSSVAADLKSDDPWFLCTVTQVEEVKSIIRILPIFASTIVLNCIFAQLQTFSIHQGSTTDTRLWKHFHIPPASLPAIPVTIMLILLPLYEKIFVPFARRITGRASGISCLQRIGVGLILSAISMGVAALVEVKRKNVASEHHLLQSPHATIPLSVFWLAPQYFVFGLADMFTLVGLMEFFYSESPPGMRSLSSALTFTSISCGFFLSSALVSIVNKATKSGSQDMGWLGGNNLNVNKLNYFYWLLCALGMLSFFHFLFWAWWYRYKEITYQIRSESISRGSNSSSTSEELLSPVSLEEITHSIEI